MKTKRNIFIIVLILLSNVVFAGQDRGGGDEVALDFINAFNVASKNIKLIDSSALPIKKINPNIEFSLKNVNIIVVDEDLQIQAGKSIQNSVAANDPHTKTIWINRSRWNSIQDVRIKEGIALHEFLSLHQIETTGTYTISMIYVSARGVPASVNFKANWGLAVETQNASNIHGNQREGDFFNDSCTYVASSLDFDNAHDSPLFDKSEFGRVDTFARLKILAYVPVKLNGIVGEGVKFLVLSQPRYDQGEAKPGMVLNAYPLSSAIVVGVAIAHAVSARSNSPLKSCRRLNL